MVDKVEDLAERVAALQPNEIEAFEQVLAELRAASARAEKERVERLKAMTADEAVTAALEAGVGGIRWDQTDVAHVLRVLRDAGFVRGLTLEAAYREGYERGAYDHGASSESLRDVEDGDYVQCRGWDLASLARKAAAACVEPGALAKAGIERVPPGIRQIAREAVANARRA